MRKTWDNVGCYPTPAKFVEEFVDVVQPFLNKKFSSNKKIELLDIFAGDGRLGEAFIKHMERKKISSTFVEIMKTTAKEIHRRVPGGKVLALNAFSWTPDHKFDLVVSNPPYKRLREKGSKEFGFAWDYAKDHARNLYALGIIKCLEVCKSNGIVVVIAPFSWLRGVHSEKFRQQLESHCSEIFIKANNNRGIFDEVHQDVGIQIFLKREDGNQKITKWAFGYNGSRKFTKITIHKNKKDLIKSHNYKAVVGSIVWNRMKKFLTSKKTLKTLPVIYGGNITKNGKLDLSLERYQPKQYIKKSALVPTDILETPLILIRRVMRGRPGKWGIDSCLLRKSFICTVENHVIAIRLPKGEENFLKQLHDKLISRLRHHYYLSGSPNISGTVVKQILGEILQKKGY